MSEDESKERLSVIEAADALGVTRDAIHKRIRRGSIEHEKGEDGRLYVYVDTATTDVDDSVEGSKDASTVESLERLIRAQQERIEDLREQLSSEREANRENRRIIAGLTSRIPQLEAPNEPQNQPETPAEEPGRATEEPQRPWWRRLWRT